MLTSASCTPTEGKAEPYKGREGGLFSVALEPFELLTYKFVTFTKYEFNIFNQNLSSIDNRLVYFTGTYSQFLQNYFSRSKIRTLISLTEKSPG